MHLNYDSPAFLKDYTYTGNDLGAAITAEGTFFKLWAPTAERVELRLYTAGEGGYAYGTLEMEKGERGVWTARAGCGHGCYYTYAVTINGKTTETVDPYAGAVGVNGQRGMVLDYSRTDPEGFREDSFRKGLTSYSEAVIWEVQVRDFSVFLPGSNYPGKYLAMTETGLKNSAGVPVGLDYLKNLGVTHVHLQPVYDFGSVDEHRPDSSYNWGYDPVNYNAPEGSFATDAMDGCTRIRELKQLVMALHKAGIGVIMDVVYNHTFSTDSCFEHTVPGYYYRKDTHGRLTNGSGCGNETASERPMFRRYMVDSVCRWAREYHMDGFRFDLMAVHDTDTMQAIEAALHSINPACIIYGEPWTGGTSALPEERRSTVKNLQALKKTAGAAGCVAAFGDGLRDGLKGSVFLKEKGGYINGNADAEHTARVMAGLLCGAESICYMSCHDNMTLLDKLRAVEPRATQARLAQECRLGAACTALSGGAMFFLAGEEMLRSKLGEENSYCSPDNVNGIRWEALVPGSEEYKTCEWYRELIRIRRENSFLREADAAAELLQEQVIAVSWRKGGQMAAYALFNPNDKALQLPLPAETRHYLLGTPGANPGRAELPAKGVILVKAGN